MGDSAVLPHVSGVGATYQNAIIVSHNTNLTIQRGEVHALLGANSTDKSGALKTISNLLMLERGQTTAGTIVFDGYDIAHTTPAQLVRLGLIQVPEGRRYLPNLSIESNLAMGTLGRSASRAKTAADLEHVYTVLPRLKTQHKVATGLTSDGEQQMAVIGRALMSRPRLLVLDEPSMGLAPLIVQDIFARLWQLNREDGLSILMAGQNPTVALQYADRTTMLKAGVTVLNDTAKVLGQCKDIQYFYFGRDAAHQAPALARAAHSSFPIIRDNRDGNLS